MSPWCPQSMHPLEKPPEALEQHRLPGAQFLLPSSMEIQTCALQQWGLNKQYNPSVSLLGL